MTVNTKLLSPKVDLHHDLHHIGLLNTQPLSIYRSTMMDHQNPKFKSQTPITTIPTTAVSSLNFSVNAILSSGGCSNGRSNSTSSNCSTGSNGSSCSGGQGGMSILHHQNIYDTGQIQQNQHLHSAAFLRMTAAAAAAAQAMTASSSGKTILPIYLYIHYKCCFILYVYISTRK